MIDLSNHPNLAVDTVLECDTCGITLLTTKVDGDTVEVEITDEGK